MISRRRFLGSTILSGLAAFIGLKPKTVESANRIETATAVAPDVEYTLIRSISLFGRNLYVNGMTFSKVEEIGVMHGILHLEGRVEDPPIYCRPPMQLHFPQGILLGPGDRIQASVNGDNSVDVFVNDDYRIARMQ